MNWRLIFTKKLNVGQRLVRLHHANAIIFTVLAITGFLLFSSSFRLVFPAIRVWVRESHVWIGFISLLPILFYMPKMQKHLKTLRKRKNHRINLYYVLTVLCTLILSGVVLTYHRHVPPLISSSALVIHDLATWLGVPYLIYHSVTRSKWFKRLVKPVKKEEKPLVVEDHNPIYRRRTFLQLITGLIIMLVFSPSILKWLRTYFPELEPKSRVADANQFRNPQPAGDSAPPIGGGRRGEFRYYTVTEMPTQSEENWQFSIDGLVNNTQSYDWDQFLQLKRDVQVSNFYCVTGWSVYDVTWEGIPLKKLLEDANVTKQARFVKFYSADGVYTDTLTIEQAMMDDVMVAVLIDGELISKKNGGPVRLIVPEMYAYKSVKWLNRIELIEEEHVGYWEKRGYSTDAWVSKS
ncbi:molybdopterin-dependent oxidoreductase [Gracilibacillus salinarum]|uniref:Molybdopterin-dependent oxidoreductase n=1 Tax=Gracilibacillus salinarum TaxID=2932255 RepID=A0ABY4GM80_9BACI|nr:molybdopterin-dependent oxidoreductase [Gracilibacillus salinarum]UOQ84857.1 molybdopterin-dependent oxidoreductase [Gracilibacillus salinarum]